MKSFKEFLDALDTTGGHIFIFLVILLITASGAMVLVIKGHPMGEGVGGFIAGTLFPTFFAILKGTGKANGVRAPGSLTRSNDPKPEVAVR